MQNQTCPRCFGPTDPGFRYCKNCGLDLANPYPAYQPPAAVAPDAGAHDRQRLFIVLLAKYGILAFMFLFSRLVDLIGFSWVAIRVSNIVLSLGFVALLLIVAIQVNNPRVKTFLWIFFGIEVIQLIYRTFFGYGYIFGGFY